MKLFFFPRLLCLNVLVLETDGPYPVLLSTRDLFSGPDTTSPQRSAAS